MEVEDGYPSIVRDIMRTIKQDTPRARALYTSAAVLAECVRPDSAHNFELFDLLDSPTARYLRITAAQLAKALDAKRKQLQRQVRETQKQAEKQAKDADKQAQAERKEAERQAKDAEKQAKDADKQAQAERKEAEKRAKEAEKRAKEDAREQRQDDIEEALQATLGGLPANEREFVALLMTRNGTTMSFDRQFRRNGEPEKGEQILTDVHLTAADLNLVKPRGDLLSVGHLDRAFNEWCHFQREGAIERVMAQIFALPPDAPAADVIIAQFRRICGFYFRDPAFAAAAILKAIWQIKRMLLDMQVEQRHMFILLGQQNCGKSYFWRMIMAAIGELVAEASLRDVLDERQMDLPTYGAILLDELVSADRADSAALKNFVTGTDWARRPMRTNFAEKVKLRASLFGTSNHSLGKLIYDSTGMRRFVELQVLSRPEIEPNWQAIIGFDWTQLWQAVDVEMADPLTSAFAAELMARQEELRNPENTETWLLQFEPERGHNVHEWTARHVAYYAYDLYLEFKKWEAEFDRGWRGTSLSRWGRDMKSLIEQGYAPGWTTDKANNKTVYVLKWSEGADVPASNGSGTVHDLRSRMSRPSRNPYNSL